MNFLTSGYQKVNIYEWLGRADDVTQQNDKINSEPATFNLFKSVKQARKKKLIVFVNM